MRDKIEVTLKVNGYTYKTVIAIDPCLASSLEREDYEAIRESCKIKLSRAAQKDQQKKKLLQEYESITNPPVELERFR